ncbi:MAG: CPBP family intramembrane glutamic endopeptidase [Paenibacillaceae bacterium]
MKRIKLRNIKLRKVNIREISERTLLINLYFTQALILLFAFLLMWWLHITLGNLLIAHSGAGATIVTYGILFAAVVLFSDYILARWIPKHVTDDGGMNEKIFANRSLWHLIVICLVVSVCEELLFRGAVQNSIGVYWTSVLFTAIHVRYLQHWLMTLLVFAISYGLGWIYMQTGTLFTPIIAHFIIDFVLGYHLRGGSIE